MRLDILEIWNKRSGNDLKNFVELTLALNEHDVRRYVMAVLDPMVTYGVKGKLTEGRGFMEFGAEAYGLLSDLATRRVTGNAAKAALNHFCEGHRAEACPELHALLAWRRLRSDDDRPVWAAQFTIESPPADENSGKV